MPAVVLDVNILVSAQITPTGPAGRIMNAWIRRDIDIIISAVIIDKVDEVLHRPHILNTYPIDEDDIQALRHLLEEEAIRTPHLLDLQVITEDPEDDTILIAAVEGKADCIVSGDAHLKNLGTYRDIPILTPSDFINRYNIS